ncbi:MAG: quinone-dependent dihydroorotate dehydrogenase [Saprospiraceae bacterium]|nr:quinone-dependent dihydroorotate dehydrogenase [Saprospiraceae bacterium]
MYEKIIKPILFQLSPEYAHRFTTHQLKWLSKYGITKTLLHATWGLDDARLHRQVLGLHFKNPIGLAAGFDKDAQYIEAFSNLGFGFIEVGTVTPKAQPGNPLPRLFRLQKDQALINRMGFNNQGVEVMVERLKRVEWHNIIIGGNIGKNKVTPNEEANEDYKACFEALFPYVDYFVVNVSSPNTPGLRSLQEKEPLDKLLSMLQTLNQRQTAAKPLLLKISPNLSWPQLDDVLEVVEANGVDGIIATNTSLDRLGLKTSKSSLEAIGHGGLSGAPITSRSTEVIKYIRDQAGDALAIVGVGGIVTANDAIEKLDAGADLIQLYTGLIYRGPKLIKDIKVQLLKQGRH